MATQQQLAAALKAADAAGNVEDARRLAKAYAAARAVKTHMSQSQTPPAAMTPPASETAPDATGSFGENLAAGFGASFVNTGKGLRQLGTDAARHFVEAGLGQEAPGLRQSLVDQQAEIDADHRLQQQLMTSGGGAVGNIAGQITQLAVPVGGVKAAQALGRAAPVVTGGARAGAYGAAQGVGTGESRLENTAEQTAWGAGGGAFAQGLGVVASKAKSAIEPEFAALVQKARDFKIPLHISQLTDSKAAKTISSALNYLPLSGGSKAIRNQQEAFNRAIGGTFDAPAKNLSDTVMANVKKTFSNTYNSIFAGKQIPLDKPAIGELQALRTAAARDLELAPRKVVERQIDRIVENATNGTLTGKLYQSLRGELKRFDDGSMKGAQIMEARKILDEAAKRALEPKEAARLVATNGKYANFKTAQDALKQVAGARGNISPASLWNLIKKGSTQEMRDLAKIGQVLLKDAIPDSGTAARAAVYSALGASGAANPAMIPLLAKGALIGATAGRLGNSPRVAAALTQGKPLNAFARIAKPAPVLLPVASAASEKKKRP